MRSRKIESCLVLHDMTLIRNRGFQAKQETASTSGEDLDDKYLTVLSRLTGCVGSDAVSKTARNDESKKRYQFCVPRSPLAHLPHPWRGKYFKFAVLSLVNFVGVLLDEQS